MRPHDLLRLTSSAGLRHEETVPAWVHTSLAQAHWVVVRRARAPDGLIPVGVRGHARAERFAALLAPDGVAACVTPENLAAARGWRHMPRAYWVGSLQVLDAVNELFASLGFAWGPTGSVGFELATGVAAASTTSDLDVVVRAPEPWPLETALDIADKLARLPARVDVQLDAPAGVVMLAEYARGGRVLLRTPDGPRLTCDPWREAATGLRSA
ncbi:MAG: malonate decarboxylase holo-ACP synthase [Actinomycetota bacterium]|nr:malonate decarboxylase holo-ACP synthase [Actinomycetota bacterium]